MNLRQSYIGTSLHKVPWKILRIGDEVKYTSFLGEGESREIAGVIVELDSHPTYNQISVSWDRETNVRGQYIHECKTPIRWFGPLIWEEIV